MDRQTATEPTRQDTPPRPLPAGSPRRYAWPDIDDDEAAEEAHAPVRQPHARPL